MNDILTIQEFENKVKNKSKIIYKKLFLRISKKVNYSKKSKFGQKIDKNFDDNLLLCGFFTYILKKVNLVYKKNYFKKI